MPLLPDSTPQPHAALNAALCVCNIATACELGFAAATLVQLARHDNHGVFKAAYVPFVAMAALLSVTGAVLASLAWRESIGTAVFNLVYSLFVSAATGIVTANHAFRLLFCAMGIAPLLGSALSLRRVLLLRREGRTTSVYRYKHWEDEAADSSADDSTPSLHASPRSTPYRNA